MRRMAGAVLVLAMMVAGCTQVSAESVASDAAEALQDAVGEAGELSAMHAEIRMGMGDAAFTVVAEAEFHDGDAATVRIGFGAAELGDEDAQRAMEAVRFTWYCSAERMVLQTSGLDGMGQEDVDVETENTVGVCMQPDAEDWQAYRDSTVALFHELGPTFAGMADLIPTEIPEYTLLEAEWVDGDVVARFQVEDGTGASMETQATIVDGRIVAEETSVEIDGVGPITGSTTYTYGARSPDPGLRGVETV